MSPIHRSILAVAATFFAAGAAVGLVAPRLWGLIAPPPDAADPVMAFVDRFDAKYDLTRDQRRILWMIVGERDTEELQFMKSRVQALSAVDREQLQAIARRADTRIKQLLDERQRQQFVADLRDPKDSK